MYSLVVAAMLTTGANVPAWGCQGCHGCHGFIIGCHGCYGCFGGCAGCYGGSACYGCSGCYGCFGGCYGCYGCAGGACYGGFGGAGCYGGSGGYGAGTWWPTPTPPPSEKKKDENKSARSSNQATVIVQLPAEAALYIDGQRSNLTSAARTLITPELAPGRDYFYTLKAEAIRDGKVVTQTKRVIVRAGHIRVDFSDLAMAKPEPPGKAPAHVTVKLPEDARLYVDDVLCPLTSSRRAFDTPGLEPKRDYYYTLRAELLRNGQVRSESKRVLVRAGADVTIDFENLPALTAARR